MFKIKINLALLFILLSAVFYVSSASAQTVGQCVRQANQESKACKSNCEQVREDAVLNCRVPEGDCGDACKAAFQGCAAPFETERKECLDDCDTEFETDRTNCATQCSCTLNGDCGNSACFGACIFAPAVDKAVCRVACFRDATVKAGLRACRRAVRICAKTCEDDEEE